MGWSVEDVANTNAVDGHVDRHGRRFGTGLR